MHFLLNSLVALLVLALASTTKGQDCNICGDGNTIQFQNGVVEFEYEGSKVKNNCLQLQQTVANVNAISDEFCRTELLQYTKDTCRCTTLDGDLLSDIEPPTISPTPGSVSAESPTGGDDTAIDNDRNNEPTAVVSKCEQASDNDKGCDDGNDEGKDASSATNEWFLHTVSIFVGLLASLVFVV